MKTREIILDTAHRMFLDEGYRKTSMRKIAHKAGLTTGAIYHFFSNKGEILFYLCYRVVTELYIDVRNIYSREDLKAREKLYGYFCLYRAMYQGQRDNYRLMTWAFSNNEELDMRPELMEKIMKTRVEIIKLLEKTVEEGIKEGIVKTSDPHKFALYLHLVVQGFFITYDNGVMEAVNVEMDEAFEFVCGVVGIDKN